MGTVIDWFFSPPSMPRIPLPPHMAEGVLDFIGESYKLVYLRGVYDGFVAGALLVLIFIPSVCPKKGREL